ncbi:MAG: hypothetical protein WD157_00255, partial [Patescibacteria group bacterium]
RARWPNCSSPRQLPRRRYRSLRRRYRRRRWPKSHHYRRYPLRRKRPDYFRAHYCTGAGDKDVD